MNEYQKGKMVKSCGRKVGFKTKVGAQSTARHMFHKKKRKLVPYKCKYCFLFHNVI